MKWAIAIAATITAASLMGGCSQSSHKVSQVVLPQDQMVADARPSAGMGDALGMTQYARHPMGHEPVVSAVVYPR